MRLFETQPLLPLHWALFPQTWRNLLLLLLPRRRRRRRLKKYLLLPSEYIFGIAAADQPSRARGFRVSIRLDWRLVPILKPSEMEKGKRQSSLIKIGHIWMEEPPPTPPPPLHTQPMHEAAAALLFFLHTKVGDSPGECTTVSPLSISPRHFPLAIFPSPFSPIC
jgi:hypothetical protein